LQNKNNQLHEEKNIDEDKNKDDNEDEEVI